MKLSVCKIHIYTSVLWYERYTFEFNAGAFISPLSGVIQVNSGYIAQQASGCLCLCTNDFIDYPCLDYANCVKCKENCSDTEKEHLAKSMREV